MTFLLSKGYDHNLIISILSYLFHLLESYLPLYLYGLETQQKSSYLILPRMFYKVRWAHVTHNLLYEAHCNVDQWEGDVFYDYYWAVQPVHQKVGKT
jgi:hypothetical protein